MSEPTQTLDVEAIADRARTLWREAMGRTTTARIELFAKVALRCRVATDLDGAGATIDRVHESGLAVRAFQAGQDRAGFAASSGLSGEAVRWAVDTACTYRAQAPLVVPGSADPVGAERWDLDAAVSLPSEEDLTAALLARPHLEWIEAGTTVEVLLGAEGWLAARRRHRLWSLGGVSGARLIAQRGFEGWEARLDLPDGGDAVQAPSLAESRDVLVVTPDAAAPLVTALVANFHGAGAQRPTSCGAGWSVADEPARADGLAGGTFDDSGFPAGSRTLAENGLWVDRLGGPGTFRRASFREPPVESATNLVIGPGSATKVPAEAIIACRCRVLRQSNELWVIELGLAGRGGGAGLERRWIRVGPESLLAACASRIGPQRLTAEGPIVPALVFEGLRG